MDSLSYITFFVLIDLVTFQYDSQFQGARCSSVVRAFAHGVMGRRIDPSLGGLIELHYLLRIDWSCDFPVRLLVSGSEM